MPSPLSEMTAKEKTKHTARLVYEIGSIIEDRRDNNLSPEEQARLWNYLWEEGTDWLYTEIGPLIDRVEDEVFPEEGP